MGLLIKRKRNQTIRVGPDITITLGETRGSYTAIIIDAPRQVPVWRGEDVTFHANRSGDDAQGDSGGSTEGGRTDSGSEHSCAG